MATDFELLDAWRAGDVQAGNALFERYFDSLYGFFRNKAPDSAEDLVQQTLLACVKAEPRFRKDASFRTYVFRVARSKLYDALSQRRREAVIDFGSTSLADLGSSPSQILARDEQEQLLVQALRQLPLQLQVLLELRFFENLSGPELAGVLELPEGTVRSRLRRAQVLLAEHVQRLAEHPAAAARTMTRLEDWALALRDGEE